MATGHVQPSMEEERALSLFPGTKTMPGHHLLEPEGQWGSTVECGQECPTHSDFLSHLVKAGGTSRAFLAKTLKHRPSWITQSSLQAFALEKIVGEKFNKEGPWIGGQAPNSMPWSTVGLCLNQAIRLSWGRETLLLTPELPQI